MMRAAFLDRRTEEAMGKDKKKKDEDEEDDESTAEPASGGSDPVSGEPAPAEPLKRKAYERELGKLHVELVRLQDWIRHKGLKVVVIFEGRDAAGKGGAIKAITQTLNPRVCRVVALGTPTERRRRSSTSSATSHSSPRRARWCCSTGAGTTAPASSGSWASAPRTSTGSSCARVPSSSACSPAPGSS
jgi:polyphosphate kinase 2 (PPK2 family)